LYYAKALYKNGKCDLAKPWLEKYKAMSKENPHCEIPFFEIDLTNCEEFVKMIPPPRNDFYEIRKLPFNTIADDFSPVFFKDGFIFVSDCDYKRTDIYSNTPPFEELFFTEIDTIDTQYLEYQYDKKPQKYSNPLNANYYNLSVCFNKEQNKVFFTRNDAIVYQVKERHKKETNHLKIFTADLDDDKWLNIQSFPFNSDEYSIAYPSLDAEGKTLYFSSDMPGGFGGMDLYYSVLEDDEWSPPRNLGPRINTANNEVFPYIHTSGRLYFSSNGHSGLGGLDIFYCDNNDGVWNNVKNIGFPINTPSDDFGFILNKTKTFGYFSSNREGGEGGDDIYSFKHNAVNVAVLVYDEKTKKPIENAAVLDDCSGLKLFTDSKGHAIFQLPLNKCCSFITDKENYNENTIEKCTHDYKTGTKVIVKIPLKSINSVIEGLVYDGETDKPLANSVVSLKSDCSNEIIEFKTDTSGRYRFVVDKGCCYYLKAAYKGYFTVSSDKPYCTKEMTKSDTLIYDFPLFRYIDTLPNDSSKIQENNPCKGIGRTFVIRHDYYDFNQSDISKDTIEPLKELIKILEDNPDLVIEICTTDFRGSERYSIRFPTVHQFVVKYLIKKGINPNRLRMKEEIILPPNSAENEISSVEEPHRRMRRTTFRVIGKLDGTRYDCENEVLDKQTPVQPKIEKCENCPF
jgi:hypothetical protein